jgi:hypothetical protein
MSADVVTTDQPIVTGGLRTVRFFNGRLLTGEDLTREQEANGLARLRLGRVLGAGVAHGLDVSPAAATSNPRPVVHVEAGAAVNARGRVLELSSATDLALTHERLDGTGEDVLFHDCTPFQPATYSAGAGAYLLTIAPASRNEGRAKVTGLGNEQAACNVAFSVEGVQFHLLQIALPSDVLGAGDRLRNRLAHLLLGTADARRAAFERNPLGPRHETYGLLDDLRSAGCLDDEQVPLAVLVWTAAAGIRFVDLWAVRRRIAAPAADRLLPTLTGDRRRAEAEATFLQFQGQIDDALASGPPLGAIAAADLFTFLPPVGIVPISGPGSPAGFDPDGFLGAQGSEDLATTDAALLRALVQESFDHDPIEVGGGERVQRYVLWENEQAVAAGTVSRRVLVFARRTLPHRGIARYGRARFGVSRFAPSVI